ncbi:hypothetical protein [Dyella nitratireducens]|uniref:Uncharacterized protein n=2 Tax=Dyella nitratireducens TaxID=1849580 RepID=A0ABQ1FK35_9GAMM|nr:hypothetical protein GCM10010981_00710 [Dyella nitratireducens]GLQ44868.1 hypothetical protein GCM10007902_47180 [Dyella nitratireducens]
MSKRELAEYREWFLDILPERIRILEVIVRTTPGFERWHADETPESLDTLGEWLASQVETRARAPEELAKLREETPHQFKDILPVEQWELTNRTYSLAMDCGMYLGQVMLRTHSERLQWGQDLRDRRSMDYGQVLIVGTGVVSMDTVGFLVSMAQNFVRKTGKRDLRAVYDIWSGPESGLFVPPPAKKVRKPRS